jgi:ribosome biogenesis GTPase A
LAALVHSTIEHIKETDKDYELVHLRLMRNKELLSKEQEMDQVQSETKKHIKTEKVISKEFKDPKEKPKKGSIV